MSILGDYYKYFIIALSIFLFISVFKSFAHVKRAEERLDSARERVVNLESEKMRLQSELERSQSEEFIETQLRNQLNLAREGEIVIVLPDEEFLRSLAPEDEPENQGELVQIWKKWVILFF